jgi:putative ATPase
MADLFSQLDKRGYTPLAERMRPRTLDEVIGQAHILGKGAPLRMAVEAGALPSVILWGPPGSGKTTIANAIANSSKAKFFKISAVLAGVKDVREIIDAARDERRATGLKTILFVDEIHRFNKAQQDAFLPHVEAGTVVLVGATTENPSFEVISPLLSRVKVYVLKPLEVEDIKTLVTRTLEDKERGLGRENVDIGLDAIEQIAKTSDGDGRRALNTLEIALTLAKRGAKSGKKAVKISVDDINSSIQKKALLYDKLGEEHYNIISAFIKSMRGSNPDAAVYWMARMLSAGEDPLFIARRMVIFASEDIGNADPQAIQVAISAMQALDFVGMPEGWIPLAQSATYLATAPKSKAAYLAYKGAVKDVEEKGVLPVPLHLRNAVTDLMANLGYGQEYKNPQKFKGNFVSQQYLPDELAGRIYYEPTENGYEKHISERLKKWR